MTMGFFLTIMIISVNNINHSLLRFLTDVERNYPYYLPQFEIMHSLGVRSVESVEKNRWTFIDDNYLLLDPGKNNNQRLFNLSLVPDSFLSYLRHEHLRECDVNYQKLNYVFSKVFLYSQVYIGNKECKLHIFRHNYAKVLLEFGFSPEEIRDKLGEKNQSSADAYITSEFRTNPYILPRYKKLE